MAAWWQEFVQTLQQEFSDLPDVSTITRISVRLIVAATLGGLLGYERENCGKPAGLRTHMLVAIGSALFVLILEQNHAQTADIARVVQGLVAGIGFLGTGAILKDDDSGKVQGLTTAAGIWMTAAIGIAAGLGRESTAILSTLLAIAILSFLPRIAGWCVSSGGRLFGFAKPGTPEGDQAAARPRPDPKSRRRSQGRGT